MIDTSIIIVNWNGEKHLRVCLDSLRKQIYKNFEIILVDNGSQDGSVNFVKSNYPEVKIIGLDRNFGFAQGNNIGIKEAFKNDQIKYIVALNNDTEVKVDWLEKLINTAKENEKVGAVASKTLFFDERDKIDSVGDFFSSGTLKVVTRGHGEKDRGQYDKIEECFSARAAACLYKREMLEDINLWGDYFDSSYFAYIEDTDLSMRARLIGWQIIYEPRAVVYHKVAATSAKISNTFKKYYSGRNRIMTVLKNLPVKMWPKILKGDMEQNNLHAFNAFEVYMIYARISVSIMQNLFNIFKKRRLIQAHKKLDKEEILAWPDKFKINHAGNIQR